MKANELSCSSCGPKFRGLFTVKQQAEKDGSRLCMSCGAAKSKSYRIRHRPNPQKRGQNWRNESPTILPGSNAWRPS